MITSRGRGDSYDVPIARGDFESGGLRIDSYVRACHPFTVDEAVIEYKAGKLSDEKIREVVDKIVALLNA